MAIRSDAGMVGGGNPKMQAIGACMRKLVMLCYGVLKNRAPFAPGWASKQASWQHAIWFGAARLSHHAERSEPACAGRRSTATPCRVKKVIQTDADTNSHPSWSNSLRACSSWRICWCMPPIQRPRSFGP